MRCGGQEPELGASAPPALELSCAQPGDSLASVSLHLADSLSPQGPRRPALLCAEFWAGGPQHRQFCWASLPLPAPSAGRRCGLLSACRCQGVGSGGDCYEPRVGAGRAGSQRSRDPQGGQARQKPGEGSRQCFPPCPLQAAKLKARLTLMEGWLQGSDCGSPWGPMDVLQGEAPRGDIYQGLQLQGTAGDGRQGERCLVGRPLRSPLAGLSML